MLRWVPLVIASHPFHAGEPVASAPFDRSRLTPTAWFDPARIGNGGPTVTLAEFLSALLGSPEAASPVIAQVAANLEAWIDLELPRPGPPGGGVVQVGTFHHLIPMEGGQQILLAWYGQRLPQIEEECRRLQVDLERARRALAELESGARRERARVETLLEAAGGPVSIQDTDYRIVAQNEPHRSLFGDRRGETCHQVYRQRTEPCAGCPMAEALSSRESAWFEDRPDQGPLAGSTVHIQALPLFGPDHSPGGIVEVFSRPDTAAVERDVEVMSPAVRLREHQMQHILGVLERSGGNRAQAARLLGISRATLWRRLGSQPGRRPRDTE
jgi:hypothetical protein